jgi:hypothetical protein
MNSVIRMRRSWPVTLVAVGVFLFAAMQASAVWQVWSQRALLAGLPLAIAPAFWIIQGLMWAGLGFAAARGLWRLRRWALWLTALGAPVYALAWTIERWLWSGSFDSRFGCPSRSPCIIGVIVIEVFLLAPGLFRRLAGVDGFDSSSKLCASSANRSCSAADRSASRRSTSAGAYGANA